MSRNQRTTTMTGNDNKTMIDSDVFNREREQFFIKTHGSVFLPITGIFFWPSMGVAGYFLSPQAWGIIVLFFLLVLLPSGFALLWYLQKKGDFKSPLGSLYLPALVPLLISIGITVPAYFSDLSLVPLTFVLGLALHWPVIGWLYNQPVYIVHTLLRTVIAVSIWMFFPEQLFTVLPLLVGLLYLLTTWWILRILSQLKMKKPI